MRAAASLLAVASLLPLQALAQTSLPNMPPMTGVIGNSTIAGNATSSTNPDSSGKYQIEAEGIRAKFIPYGASISNLFIKDIHGVERDIVFGFDNASYYTVDPVHGHWGAVPGRYANRIKNSTFELDGVTYHTEPNEHIGVPGAEDTLHGGPEGWDHRNWTVVTHTTDSITFSLVALNGEEGFPGQVIAYVTYSVSPYTWHIQMTAKSTEKPSPIMLSSHVYWNLDGWQNPNTALVLNHTLSLPYAGQRVQVDGNLIPTGEIAYIEPNSVNDFYSHPKQIGQNFSEALGNCGTDCRGYDTCFVFNREAAGEADWRNSGPVASLRSDWSGIQVDVYSNQAAYQIYSCGGQNGSTPLKSTQGLHNGRPRVLEQYGCVVMEVEDWIDGINYPAWGRNPKQVFGPTDPPYVLQADLKFSASMSNSSSMSMGGSMKYGSMMPKRRM